MRTRYVAVRDLLTHYGRQGFHETLLASLGSARLPRKRVVDHIEALVDVFDAASPAIRTPFPFASDVSKYSRAIAIDGSVELVERGYHREAIFWVGITHPRCRKILAPDAPEHLNRDFNDGYLKLLGDLGVPAFGEIQRRYKEIERVLPRVCEVAEQILASNGDVEDD